MVVVPAFGELRRLAPTPLPPDETNYEEISDSASRIGLIGVFMVAAGLLSSCVSSNMRYTKESPGSSQDNVLALFLFSIACSTWGTSLFAFARGRTILWGFFGLFGPIGLRILLFVRPRKR